MAIMMKFVEYFHQLDNCTLSKVIIFIKVEMSERKIQYCRKESQNRTKINSYGYVSLYLYVFALFFVNLCCNDSISVPF